MVGFGLVTSRLPFLVLLVGRAAGRPGPLGPLLREALSTAQMTTSFCSVSMVETRNAPIARTPTVAG